MTTKQKELLKNCIESSILSGFYGNNAFFNELIDNYEMLKTELNPEVAKAFRNLALTIYDTI